MGQALKLTGQELTSLMGDEYIPPFYLSVALPEATGLDPRPLASWPSSLLSDGPFVLHCELHATMCLPRLVGEHLMRTGKTHWVP